MDRQINKGGTGGGTERERRQTDGGIKEGGMGRMDNTK